MYSLYLCLKSITFSWLNLSKKVDSNEEDLDEAYCAVKVLVSNDFSSDLFKFILNYLQNFAVCHLGICYLD